MALNLNVMVGGEAGQGVQSVGAIMAKAFSRGGYHVFADQEYESRVRGGHNTFRVRVSDTEVGAICETVDILLALNSECKEVHRGEVRDGGVVVFDEEKAKDVKMDGLLFGVPLERLAREKAGNKLMANSVALGAAMGLVAYDFDMLSGILREHFGEGEAGEGNIAAAAEGYRYAATRSKEEPKQSTPPLGGPRRMLVNGNEGIALGAVAAGCTFLAAYPMTPATPIMEYLAGKSAELGLVVVQPEDEVSAINMIVGAAYSGARAMTVTSGGGFCLMVEGLSLAGMTETPVVAVLAQRPGPAIGLPTRTEQGELLFALHAGHGEFPRAVLAPASVEDAFWLTVKAFNLAERYQVPVLILTDHHLASSYATVEKFDLSRVKIDRGQLLSEEEVDKPNEYKRYLITESGVSPRALPLQGKALVATDSDEHDENGHIIEDAETRSLMMLKRLRKLDGLAAEIGGPIVHKSRGAELTLVGWGSTYGAIKEAVALLEKEGVEADMLHLNGLWPFPSEAVSAALDGVGKSVVVENNATGQLARLIRAETGIRVGGSILKFDGRPFSPEYIVRELKKEVV
ncbi:2-oxoacid:acceptor oxidoreductase subunit alpha [Chloroflexota bacterium]